MKHTNEVSIPRPVVIVVDDDRAVRNSLKFSLEVEGFAVKAYACAGDLLACDIRTGCACFVVDQILPGMNGLDLIARLRERRIATPAILVTTQPALAVRERAARDHVRIVEKPLLGNTLVDAIRDACMPPADNSRGT
jgi:two-component system, LuxR family, response regulator FixJ